MYESPIEKMVGKIQSQIIKQDEENMMYAVKQAIGYSVDKDELIKALNYDRAQYEKGYCDGLNACMWIPVSERMPENRNQEVLISLKWGIDIGRYSDGEWHSEWINHYDDGNVLAWMPLPEPFKAESEEGHE